MNDVARLDSELERRLAGLPVKCFVFNIDKEKDWNASNIKRLQVNGDALVTGLEQNMLYISRENDEVWLHRHVDPDFLAYVRGAGFGKGKIRLLEEVYDVDSAATMMPYMSSDETASFAGKLGMRYFGADPELVKRLSNKIHCRELGARLGLRTTEGNLCRTPTGMTAEFERLCALGFQRFVIKLPYGASGNGILIADRDTFAFMARRIPSAQTESGVLVEGWHNHLYSLNAQLWIDRDEAEILSVNQQQLGEDGAYLGTLFTPNASSDVLQEYSAAIDAISGHLIAAGYRGAIGIDAFVDADRLLYPMVELNPRFTMVTYLLPAVHRMRKQFPHDAVESRMLQATLRKPLPFAAFRQAAERIADEGIGFFIYAFVESRMDDYYSYRIGLLLHYDTPSRKAAFLDKAASLIMDLQTT